MDKCEKSPPKEFVDKENTYIANKFYSLRAWFYDKYNCRRDVDGDFESKAKDKIVSLEAELSRMKELINDDGFAVTFQSLGQYRKAINKAIRGE